MNNRPDLIFPILLFFPLLREFLAYPDPKCSIVSFHLYVAHWMIWSCMRTFDIAQCAQFFADMRFKILPLITMVALLKSVVTNKVVEDEDVCCCLGSLILVWTTMAYLVK